MVRIAGIHMQVGVVAGVQDAGRLNSKRQEDGEFMHRNSSKGLRPMGSKMSGPSPSLLRDSDMQEEMP